MDGAAVWQTLAAGGMILEPIVKSWLNAGLSFVYPEVCQLCGEERATPEESYVCDRCQAKVRFIRPPFCRRCGLPFEGQITNDFECSHCRESALEFESARSAVAARDAVLELIHRYKYRRAYWFEPLLARWLIEAAAPELAQGGWDCIVPVPLHPVRQREREFNQAERLARRLSQATGIALRTDVLRRVRPTRTQTLLSREERRENMRRAFALTRRATLDGERIVLVDDVLTTGATTSACAGVLRRGGATAVCVWTAARGI